MQILEAIIALIKNDSVEVLRHGKYRPYDILPKYDARPIGDNEIVIAINADMQSRPKEIYRRFVLIGTPEQEDRLTTLVSSTGLTHDDLVLILSTLKLNPAAFGETPIHQPNAPIRQPDTPTAGKEI